MKALAVALLFLASCAGRPIVVLDTTPPMGELEKVVGVYCDDGPAGFGVPTGLNVITSVKHIQTACLKKGYTQMYWVRLEEPHTRGRLYVTRVSQKRDLIEYMATETTEDGDEIQASLFPVRLSKDCPHPFELLYWRAILPVNGFGWGAGHFAGHPGQDPTLIEATGAYRPGSSGSPVFRASGEVVGILSQGVTGACPSWESLTVEEKVECNRFNTALPALMEAESLVGGEWE